MQSRMLIACCFATAVLLSPSNHPLRAQTPAPASAPASQTAAVFLNPMSDDQRALMQKEFLRALISQTYKQWLTLIPNEAKSPIREQAKTTIDFMVDRTGQVKKMILRFPSGQIALDRAAWGAITGSTYPPLPSGYTQDTVSVRFTFAYNPKPS